MFHGVIDGIGIGIGCQGFWKSQRYYRIFSALIIMLLRDLLEFLVSELVIDFLHDPLHVMVVVSNLLGDWCVQGGPVETTQVWTKVTIISKL